MVEYVRAHLDVISQIPATDLREVLTGPPIRIHKNTMEVAWVATLRDSGLLCNVAQVAQGGFDHFTLDHPALLHLVALSGCRRFILAHNHPHGIAIPSPADTRLTQEVAAAAEMVGYRLEDHLIFDSQGRGISMADHGLFVPRDPVLRRSA